MDVWVIGGQRFGIGGCGGHGPFHASAHPMPAHLDLTVVTSKSFEHWRPKSPSGCDDDGATAEKREHPKSTAFLIRACQRPPPTCRGFGPTTTLI